MFNKLLVISGPTASGKSRFAEVVCSITPSVIINADALQVYDALPILTAKPKDFSDRKKYRLYDSLSYDAECSVAQWVAMAEKEIKKAQSEGVLPIVVGGTGFYMKSLLYGLSDVPTVSDQVACAVKRRFDSMSRESFFNELCENDPVAAKKLHINDTYRILRASSVLEQTGRSIYSYSENQSPQHGNFLCIFFEPDRGCLYRWCDLRFQLMLDSGVVDEVSLFMKSKGSKVCAVEKAIGYRQIESYLRGEVSLEQVIKETQQFTRNYAKRQYTWFRNQIKDKKSIKFSHYNDIEQEALNYVKSYVATSS